MIHDINSVFTESGLKSIIMKNTPLDEATIDSDTSELLAKVYSYYTPKAIPNFKVPRGTFGAPQAPVPKPEPISVYDAIRREIYDLVCTDDKKYDDVRKKIAQGGSAQTVVVASIAGFVGQKYGADATSLIAGVALALLTILRIGRNSFCASFKIK